MIFGDHVSAPATPDAAQWIGMERPGSWGTVGSLVPNRYPTIVRVRAPEPGEDWWAAYRELFETIAAVGTEHTSTPDRAWYAIWEGHGFTNKGSRVLWSGDPDEEPRDQMAAERAALRAADERRNAEIREGLDAVPRFALPHRVYYLVEGPVAAVSELCEPGFPTDWRRPDLFWPHDRRWFVATDVDFWSLYVGGGDAFIEELGVRVPTSVETVMPGDRLESED